MKIKILGYVLSLKKQLPTPEEVEILSIEEKERECLINITSQENQLKFLANILDVYKERKMKEKIEQTEVSIEAANNTLIQWTVQLHTIQEWHNEH